MMITGWFKLKGYYQQEYSLIIIEDSSSVIFSLRYEISQQLILYDFKQSSKQLFVSTLMARNKWYFLKIQLILGTTSSPQDIVNILFESYGEFS